MEKENNKKKTFKGIVISDKMNKTIVVSVWRFVKHKRLGKFYKISKKYSVHDPENKYKNGDTVMFVETRPISKEKHFKVI